MSIKNKIFKMPKYRIFVDIKFIIEGERLK